MRQEDGKAWPRARAQARARTHTHTHANTLTRREGGGEGQGRRGKSGGSRADGGRRKARRASIQPQHTNIPTQYNRAHAGYPRRLLQRTDGDAGGLAAAGGDGRLPHSVAEEEGHEDLADEGRHAAVGRVDDVGAQVGGHVHFAREDHCEDDGAEQAARHLGYEIGLEGGGAGIIWQMALLEYIMSDRH